MWKHKRMNHLQHGKRLAKHIAALHHTRLAPRVVDVEDGEGCLGERHILGLGFRVQGSGARGFRV
jgi:hypothetical protein